MNDNMNSSIPPDLLQKAQQVQSAEELTALVREHGFEISPENARDYVRLMHNTGELRDEELEKVSGGGFLVRFLVNALKKMGSIF